MKWLITLLVLVFVVSATLAFYSGIRIDDTDNKKYYWMCGIGTFFMMASTVAMVVCRCNGV